MLVQWYPLFSWFEIEKTKWLNLDRNPGLLTLHQANSLFFFLTIQYYLDNREKSFFLSHRDLSLAMHRNHDLMLDLKAGSKFLFFGSLIFEMASYLYRLGQYPTSLF